MNIDLSLINSNEEKIDYEYFDLIEIENNSVYYEKTVG